MACEVRSRFAECGGLPEKVGNNTDFNLEDWNWHVLTV